MDAQLERTRTTERNALIGGKADSLSYAIRTNRNLTSVSFDQNTQQDLGGAAVVEDFVECCANGPSGIEHVIDQQYVAAFDAKR